MANVTPHQCHRCCKAKHGISRLGQGAGLLAELDSMWASAA
jgi:hypothetical protein